ncbi:MAG: hypothetical protein CM15mP74_30790 [Halieaceae bacterium]|nr:MAG: hypothetical protein CM15mP74_30790 [Halieaceae bacterium]
MVTNEQQAQQVVIRHIGGFAWPTATLLVSCVMIYLACVAHLLTDPAFSWWALGRDRLLHLCHLHPVTRSCARCGDRDESGAALDQRVDRLYRRTLSGYLLHSPSSFSLETSPLDKPPGRRSRYGPVCRQCLSLCLRG